MSRIFSTVVLLCLLLPPSPSAVSFRRLLLVNPACLSLSLSLSLTFSLTGTNALIGWGQNQDATTARLHLADPRPNVEKSENFSSGNPQPILYGKSKCYKIENEGLHAYSVMSYIAIQFNASLRIRTGTAGKGD